MYDVISQGGETKAETAEEDGPDRGGGDCVQVRPHHHEHLTMATACAYLAGPMLL